MSRIEVPVEDSWQEVPVRYRMKGYFLSIGVLLVTTSLGLGFALLSLLDSSAIPSVRQKSDLGVLQVPENIKRTAESDTTPLVKVAPEKSEILSAAYYVEESGKPDKQVEQKTRTSPVRLTGSIEFLD